MVLAVAAADAPFLALATRHAIGHQAGVHHSLVRLGRNGYDPGVLVEVLGEPKGV